MQARDVVMAKLRKPASLSWIGMAAALLAASLLLPAAASAAPPTLVVTGISGVSYQSLEAAGEVTFDEETNGGSEGIWGFQWCHPEAPGECAEFSGNWHNGPKAFTHSLPAGTTTPVAETLTGLPVGAEVLVRLEALPVTGGEFFSPEANYKSATTLAVAKPTVTIEEITAASGSTTFVGHVNPNAPQPEGSASAAEKAVFRTRWHFECVAPGASCGIRGGAAVPAGDAPKQVEVEVADLEPNQDYYVVLKGSNAGGEEEAATVASPSFSTGAFAPTVKTWSAGPVAPTSAGINAQINPHGSSATYWFEWGTANCETSSCEATVHAPVGLDEIQRVIVNATAGQFNLTYAGQTTPDLAFNESAGKVQAALEALPAIGSGNVSVEAERGHYEVTFTGSLGATDVETLSAANGASPLTLNQGSEPGGVSVELGREGGQLGVLNYVEHQLTGLQPGTTYHYRVIAESAVGTTEGPDQTFTTAAAPPATCPNEARRQELGDTGLPDCRAYEMVSPPEKNGADVIMNSYKTFAAADGDAVAYPTLAAFGDVQGTSTDVQYLSRRDPALGANGWSSHGINPPGSGAPTLQANAFSNVTAFEGAFTPDLTAAIYRSWRPLTDAPNVAGVSNLYRLRDLDSSDPQVDLLSDSAQPIAALPPVFRLSFISEFVGASTDLSHVIFQSPYNITGNGNFTGFEGNFEGNLYEYVDGIGVRLVGRVPSGTGTECDDAAGSGSPCVSAAGALAGIRSAKESAYSGGMISRDGSRILFQTPNGKLYLREDGERTHQVNASERQVPDEPGRAEAWAMSDDGARVFFTTGESLLDADEDAVPDLYMYEAEKPAGHRLTLVSVDRTGGGNFVDNVVGASADGHYVYFMSDGQFVPGEPSSVLGLYVWHDGQISFIGGFRDINELTPNLPRTQRGLITLTKTSRVSPDGRSLLFMVKSDGGFAGRGGYAGYDHGSCNYGGRGPCRELYIYSAESGRLACVSCSPRSLVANGDALTDARAGGSASPPSEHLSQALSDDGRYAFFSTPEALVPEDTNGKYDAYEYDTQTGAVHLISSGTDAADSYYMDSSPDGLDVFFATRQQLVGWDTDRSYDLYDARVGGGLPDPTPVPAACEGESCKRPPVAAPPVTPAASQALGPGNRKPAACPKGKVRKNGIRKNGKCTKKHPKRHHKEHPARHHARSRAANTDRRANR